EGKPYAPFDEAGAGNGLLQVPRQSTTLRMMNRRKFLCGLTLGTLTAVTAEAQEAKQVPTIGLLMASTRVGTEHWIDAFVRRLQELGWTERRSISIEYRWAEGRSERSAEAMAEFVSRKVNVIVTYG